jgi:penicillin-binding protein 1A
MDNETPIFQPSAPRRRGRIWRFLRFIFRTAAVLLLGVAALAAWVFYQDLTGELPSIDRLAHFAPPAVTRVYAGDRTTLLGEFFLEKRYPLPLTKIPLLVQRAFLASEDKDFYHHPGVNFSAVTRAFITNWQAGRTVQGGSTITQQIVKSVLLTSERSYRRKAQEMILALRLERQLTKEQILEIYLNQIYLGSGAYGVEAAAREYFNKGVADLALPEVAMIAGLAPAPSVYDPFKNLEGAKERQRYVLERMMEERFISYAQSMTAWQEPLMPSSSPPASYTDLAPYYVEHVRQLLEKRYGEGATQKLGLEVYTTVDLAIQKMAEKAFRDGIDALCRREGLCRSKSNRLDGGLLAADLTTGEIKAMVGGYDFNRSQFNRATQSKRQPGSVFKPIVYAAALDHGYTPASIVKDVPVSFRDGRGRRWSPGNADRRYRGPIRLREALTFSRNVPTVRIADNIGLPYLLSYATALGVTSSLAPNMSVALGSSEVTLLDMIRVYGVFATGGNRFEPVFISKITDSQGAVVSETSFQPTPVISPATAYLMTSILKGAIERGTGKEALKLGRPAAGKTGTTNDYEDAWFVGYTPELVAGVWVGFDEKRPLGSGETGGRVAAPIWTAFMKDALGESPINDFPIPDGITVAHINPVTGKRASGGNAILEIFAHGTEPGTNVPSLASGSTNPEGDAFSPSPIGTPAPTPIAVPDPAQQPLPPPIVITPPPVAQVQSPPVARLPQPSIVEESTPSAIEEEPLEESTPEVMEPEPEENAATVDDGNTPADSDDTPAPFLEENLNGGAASDPPLENSTGELSAPTAEILPPPAPQPPQ